MRTQPDSRADKPTKRSKDEIVRDRKAHLIDLVGRRLGETLSMNSLGPMAKTFLAEVAGPEMKRVLEGDERAVPAKMAKKMADDLQDLVAKDRMVSAPPADAKDRPSVLDGRTMSVVRNADGNTYSLAGAIDLGSHVVGDVLKAFDIRADALRGGVADALKVGLERRADLAQPQTWLSIVPQMAAAAMAAKGPWQARVGAAALAGVSALASQPRTVEAKATPVERPPSADAVEYRPDHRQTSHLLGAQPMSSQSLPRSPDSSGGERSPRTMAGGVLGLAQARVQSGDNRRLASQIREFTRSVGQAFPEDRPVFDEIGRMMSSASTRELGSRPNLIDLSGVSLPQPVVFPETRQAVVDFADDALGPTGLNLNVVGGNEMAAANFIGIIEGATQAAENELGRPVDLQNPQDQAHVLRVAVNHFAEVSPTARSVSQAFDSVASVPEPEEATHLRAQVGRHQRSVATTWVVEALTTRQPEATESARQHVQAALADVETQIGGHSEPPAELANARTTLTAQMQALREPDSLLGQAVLTGGLGELQHSSEEQHGPVEWSRMARSTFVRAGLDAQARLETCGAQHATVAQSAAAVAHSALAAVWNISAESAQTVFFGSGGGGGGPEGAGGGHGGGGGGPRGTNGGGGGGGGPRGTGGSGSGGGPEKINAFQTADNYAATMGARVDQRNETEEARQDFSDIRAILMDPSLEFFDKMFLVFTLMIDRMRTRIEKDQIAQLDREEMMWINEQLAHEYQKEVEMAQRDIHELGKEVDKAAGRYTKAQRKLNELEKTPANERGSDHDQQVASARDEFNSANNDWHDHMQRFDARKGVLNELRDARDAHRVQIASDRRSADIYAAKVKRNTHVVEMYMDLIKTFEDHKNRNIARMFQ